MHFSDDDSPVWTRGSLHLELFLVLLSFIRFLYLQSYHTGIPLFVSWIRDCFVLMLDKFLFVCWISSLRIEIPFHHPILSIRFICRAELFLRRTFCEDFCRTVMHIQKTWRTQDFTRSVFLNNKLLPLIFHVPPCSMCAFVFLIKNVTCCSIFQRLLVPLY